MLLGAYILGGLSDHEEFSVCAHLGRCQRCRLEYDDLANLPAVLDLFAEEFEAADLKAQPQRRGTAYSYW